MKQPRRTQLLPGPRSGTLARRAALRGLAAGALLLTFSAPAPFIASISAMRQPAASPQQQAQVRAALDAGVAFLARTQRQETRGDDFFEGEWSSTMHTLGTIPFVAKKGTIAEDSNSFTVSSVHNALAAAYLRDPGLSAIPPLLDRALERLLTYRSGDSFNFWPLLDPPANLKLDRPTRVRRPNHYPASTKFGAGFCNIVDDADDTAMSLLALKQYERIRPEAAARLELPREIGPIFSAFRDRERGLSHPYNIVERTTSTGAFLTWLAPEGSLRPGRFLPSLYHPVIPIGINDVDCVVNANVLTTLAHYQELRTDAAADGAKAACRLIVNAFKRGKQRTCGVYYPSPYNLHYAAAKAFAAGASCLEPALPLLVEDLLAGQGEDGSWKSPLKGDTAHSSLYALNALLYLQGPLAHQGDGRLRDASLLAIERGLARILRDQRATEGGGAYWPAGVFFSGGTKIRDKLVWKSEAYTTALAVDALSLWLHLNGEKR